MTRSFILIGTIAVCVAMSARAQTVTSSGTTGTVGNVPYVSAASSSSTTLGVSPLSISGSNVGIGTAAPVVPLQIAVPEGGYAATRIDIPDSNSISAVYTNGLLPGHEFDLQLSADPLNFGSGPATVPDMWFCLDGGAVCPMVMGPDGDSMLSTNPNGSIFAFFVSNPTINQTVFGDILAVSNTAWGLGSWQVGSSTVTPVALTWNTSGNVGIGTTSPTKPLDVSGTIRTTGIAGDSGGVIYPDGTAQTTAWTGVLCGGDYAESVDVGGDRAKYGPGDVMVIDPDRPGKFLKSAEPYSTAVLGIYSTRPGALGRRQTSPKSEEEVPMAMIGIVPTRVSAENGPIKPGDLLVTASTPGFAMKGTDRNRLVGAVIGKAMDRLDSGTGVIEVGVTLQ